MAEKQEVEAFMEGEEKLDDVFEESQNIMGLLGGLKANGIKEGELRGFDVYHVDNVHFSEDFQGVAEGGETLWELAEHNYVMYDVADDLVYVKEGLSAPESAGSLRFVEDLERLSEKRLELVVEK